VKVKGAHPDKKIYLHPPLTDLTFSKRFFQMMKMKGAHPDISYMNPPLTDLTFSKRFFQIIAASYESRVPGILS
jgi:predicted lactoylglutathione lyase